MKEKIKTPYKKVYLGIHTPDNDHCWDGFTPCSYFNSEFSKPICDLKIGTIVETPDGLYLKPMECRNLSGGTELSIKC